MAGRSLYNYFRDYDPGTGRYTTSDPIGLEGGMNRFAYVGGNPVSKVDPTGESAAVLGGAGLGATAILICAATPGCKKAMDDAVRRLCKNKDDDKPDCRKATKWDLVQAGILDEHAYKRGNGAVPESHYDICKCKDGTIRIAAVGMCGKTSDFWD